MKKRRVGIMLDLEYVNKRHTDTFAGTQRYAQEHGWESLVAEFADHALPTSPGKPVPFDGVIARANRRLARRAKICGVPVVNVWVNSPVSDLPSVFPDSQRQGRMVGEHLLSRGLRRFACLSIKGDRSHSLEEKGLVECLNSAGYECLIASLPFHYPHDYGQWRKTESVLKNWLEAWKPPIGVFIPVDTLARPLVQMCISFGYRVPEDVAIVTGMNDEQHVVHPAPSLTATELGYERIGYEAARLLDQLMDGQPAPGEPILIPPVGIVTRQSTDFMTADDELVAEALRYIAANSHRPVSVNEVATAIHTSRATLQRRFSQHAGRSVAAQIRFLRIERIKRQLVQTDRPIGKIALEAGFDNNQRLDETFRREVGVSPSAYRHEHTA